VLVGVVFVPQERKVSMELQMPDFHRLTKSFPSSPVFSIASATSTLNLDLMSPSAVLLLKNADRPFVRMLSTICEFLFLRQHRSHS
jgi:hypothetical protein